VAKIIVAKEAGTCFGVRRALDIVEKALAEHGAPICTLGPVIHNPRVVADLEARGVRAVSSPAEAMGRPLVLRAHGVAPEVEDEARALGAVHDATCPLVKRVHDIVERLAASGYDVVIAGEKGHSEVLGTLGHAPGSFVAGSAEDVLSLGSGKPTGRIGVVAQTTLERDVLSAICDALLDRSNELLVHNTICDATSKRQGAAAELAKVADVMLVLGGRNSANTRHLADICQGSCTSTHHVEGADEIEPSWFDGAGLIGVTAGASTPQDQIDELVSAVREMVGE
jgi:4-hydroxy-3-methylbut-2-enyl diphosphate reductase